MSSILNSVLSLSAMGLVFGAGLAYASQKFAVEVDPKEEAILNALPGANCGGCGFPGCGGLATAIAKGEAATNACPVGGAEVAEKISEIMGVNASAGTKMIANVICNGTNSNAKNKSLYSGILDCKAAS
ncbi:RnfABCDGE type electron transport complex subunit B, partial [Acetoanaerobium noterae]